LLAIILRGNLYYEKNLYAQDTTLPTTNTMIQINEPSPLDISCEVLAKVPDAIKQTMFHLIHQKLAKLRGG
jgi:hypothetical protein